MDRDGLNKDLLVSKTHMHCGFFSNNGDKLESSHRHKMGDKEKKLPSANSPLF